MSSGRSTIEHRHDMTPGGLFLRGSCRVPRWLVFAVRGSESPLVTIVPGLRLHSRTGDVHADPESLLVQNRAICQESRLTSVLPCRRSTRGGPFGQVVRVGEPMTRSTFGHVWQGPANSVGLSTGQGLARSGITTQAS